MNKFKIKKIPLEKKTNKTKLFFKIAVIFFTLSLCTTGLATIIHFVLDHQWRSPIIFQTPFYKEIKSPLVSMPVQEWEREDQGSTVSEGVTHQGDTTPLAEPYSKESIKTTLGRETIKHFGHHHVDDMIELVFRESSFNPFAQNRNSTAYGLFQFLNQTWRNYGCEKTNDVDEQINCGIRYIKARYGNPTNALKFHSERGWY